MVQNKKNNNISYQDYIKSVKNIFDLLKNNKNYKDLFLKSIEIQNNRGYFLVPLCNLHLKDDLVIQKLTDWRNRYSHTYRPNIKTTFYKTKKWIKKSVLEKTDKLLFIVMKNGYTPVGHIGFANCFNKNLNFEIDNVLKGERNKNKNFFSDTLKTLLKWANSTFYINDITLKVLHNNNRAINFYLKNNFEIFVNQKIKDKYFTSMIFNNNITNKINGFTLTAGPSISQKEIFYVNDAVTNGWNKKSSDYLNKLEKNFAKYLGCKYAIATSSCTGAMQIALMSLGIKKGDEVIVPNITWVATAKAISYVGATPVFADILINDWTLDTRSFERLITKKTKAVMPVHLYGQPASMKKIISIAKKYKIFVVEDAAPAIGAKFDGKKCGTFGEFGAFSFQGAKLLVSGEGGMLVTNNYKLYKKALKISNHGRNEKKTFIIDSEGVKFKMSNIQAALALAQLERINELIALKRRIFEWYYHELKDVKNIFLNLESANTKSIYWMTSIYLNKKINCSRKFFIDKLYDYKIDTRPVFPELSSFKIWGKYNDQNKYLNSSLISERAINLPSGVCLTKSDIVNVCNKIKLILKKV